MKRRENCLILLREGEGAQIPTNVYLVSVGQRIQPDTYQRAKCQPRYGGAHVTQRPLDVQNGLEYAFAKCGAARPVKPRNSKLDGWQ